MLTLKPYRSAGVPLLAVQTADPAGIVRMGLAEAAGDNPPPVLSWDCIHGLRPENKEAKELADTLNGNQDPAIRTGNAVEALRVIETLADSEDKPIVIMLGLADILADQSAGVPTRQALWNLRDPLASAGVIVVMAVPLGWRCPLPNDVAVAIDPLPTKDELAATVKGTLADAGVKAPAPAAMEKCCDALVGLSGFGAVQALALSLRKSGIDMPTLWARKCTQISQTRGLSVYTGSERFADIGGLDQAKDLFGRILAGRRRPGAVVFIDELEKFFGGIAGDTSGVSQALLGYVLTYMQDMNVTGAMFVGPPGAAKSAFAKAVGAEGQVPCIQLDLGGIKGSLVGESEANARAALAVITAVSAGRPLFLATCNAVALLPPELRRRFTVGTMYFDFPTEKERASIWTIYISKYGITKQPLPKADSWTGAEIRTCCDMADRLGVTLIEAARFIVPVARSSAEQIARLQSEASGRYLSAGRPGLYEVVQGPRVGRKVDV